MLLYTPLFVLNTHMHNASTKALVHNKLPSMLNMHKYAHTHKWVFIKLCSESLLNTQGVGNSVCLLGRDRDGWRIKLQEIKLLFSMHVLLLQTVN